MGLWNKYLFRNLHLCMHHIGDQAQRQEYQNGVDKVLTDIVAAVFEDGGNERGLVG
jgi:hypothetical protein